MSERQIVMHYEKFIPIKIFSSFALIILHKSIDNKNVYVKVWYIDLNGYYINLLNSNNLTLQ
jgi:hypothetical protein